MCPASRSLSLLENFYFISFDSTGAVTACNLEWLSAGYMENSLHRLVVAYTLGVVATNDAMQRVVQCNVVLLYYLIIANDVDGGIGGNKGNLVDLFVAEKVIGNLNNTLLTQLATLQVVANGNACLLVTTHLLIPPT